MLISSTTVDGYLTVLETDICIVGSGIGGGSLANLLHDKQVDFIVVEAGDLHGNSKQVSTENVGLNFKLSATTSIELGGTSNLWHGVLAPLDAIDFKKRAWIPYSGWPIQLQDLLAHYEEAARLLQVSKPDYFFEEKLPDNLTAELRKMPFDRTLLVNKLFQQPLPPVRFKDVIKQITGKSKNQHCIYNAIALELVPDANGTTINTLKVGRPDGSHFFIKAKRFVLAMGALQTPRILLNSTATNPAGIGNAEGLVGKFLMDHPMGNLFQVGFRRKQKAHIYSDMKYDASNKVKSGVVFKDEVQEQYALPNHNFYFRPSFIKGIHDESEKIKLLLLTFKDRDRRIGFKEVFDVLTHLNVAYQIFAYKFSLNVTYRYSDLFFITEQIPSPNSNVTLSNNKDQFGYAMAKVNWQLTRQDIDSMEACFKLLSAHSLPQTEFDITHRLEDVNWAETFTSAAHHVGTARMGLTAKEGVVDSSLKVFGTDNLYIADGSVFTTSGNVNSGLTIAALALRLGHYLINTR